MDRLGIGPGPGPSHASPYGQACLQCYKSKCRCVARPDGDTCERCFRLKKRCVPSDPIRKRNAQKSHDSEARINQLEDKVDSIMSMLHTVTGSSSLSTDLRKVLQDSGITTGSNSIPPSISNNDPTTTPGSSDDPLLYELTTQDAQASLDVFRSRFLSCFPFIHLPSELTAEHLRRERPLLYRAIFTVTRIPTQEKLALSRELKRLLALAAFVENDSSSDLLLAVLTYAGWSQDPLTHRTGISPRIMLLATSLIYDLRLERPAPRNARTLPSLTRGPRSQHSIDVAVPSFLERQRAVLACFTLSSMSASSNFAQMDAMRWTPQMEEALESISTSVECPSDKTLEYQVRLQLLAQKAANIKDEQTADASSVASSFATLREQVQKLKASIPITLFQKEVVLLHLHFVELCIYEAAIPTNANAPPASSPSNPVTDFDPMDCLWRCVHAIKAFLDIFCKLPPATLHGLSFNTWAQYMRCTIVLRRLYSFEHQDWDLQAVRNVVDFQEVIQWLGEKFEVVSKEVGERSDDDMFRFFAKMMKMSNRWFDSNWKIPHGRRKPQDASNWTYNGEAGAGSEDVDMLRSIDFSNENWFEDMFGLSETTL